MRIIKAHAYGNDFLFAPDDGFEPELPGLARALCRRHEGVGADGLILYAMRDRGASMRLLNADGSWSELSGNGLRCLAALVARAQDLQAGSVVTIDTSAGVKTLELLEHTSGRYVFRAAMGTPTDLRRERIAVAGEIIEASVLTMGNPQCVLLGPLPDIARFNTLGPALATHQMFPAGTNVEFAQMEEPGRVRILIWERGVGPTTSSGTGTCAAAVAAAAHGGAARELDVMSPGGTQRVEWREDGVYLTGWAEIVFEGQWIGPALG